MLKQFLTRSDVLWISFIAYVCLSLGFVLVMQAWDFLVIDELFIADDILAHLAGMSALQKEVHVLTTATLDVAYPFAYGIFQAGMAYRFLGRWGKWIAPLSLICIPIDLVEGFAQVMLLSGALDYVDLKVIVTPMKLAVYVPGLLFALVALVILVYRTVRRWRGI
ncbi:MAG: hypothetical protein AAF993_10945 [Pseudomonadota bacterium]